MNKAIDSGIILQDIEIYKECFAGSITDENKDFVEGVIYGLVIAKAAIEGILNHQVKGSEADERAACEIEQEV